MAARFISFAVVSLLIGIFVAVLTVVSVLLLPFELTREVVLAREMSAFFGLFFLTSAVSLAGAYYEAGREARCARGVGSGVVVSAIAAVLIPLPLMILSGIWEGGNATSPLGDPGRTLYPGFVILLIILGLISAAAGWCRAYAEARVTMASE